MMMFRIVVGFIVSAIVGLAGCGIFVQPTNPNDIATYNNQMFQIVTSLITVVSTLVGFVGLWVKSNWDKRELSEKTEIAARQLADASRERNERVLAEVQHTKEINVTALDAANSHNEKILELQKQVAEHSRRAPARATDKGAAVIAVPVEQVQKVEISAGPGKDTPLKVERGE